MKVQMIAQISGTRDGIDWPPIGGVLTVPDPEGSALIGTGLARVPEKNDVAPVAEKATARKAETRKGLTTKDL